MKRIINQRIGLLVLLNVFVIFGIDLEKYCDPSLCNPGRMHIACNNDLKIAPSCANFSEVIPLSPFVIQTIINKHNEYRNEVALGKVPRYPPATRMATMRWNDELQLMAELNVKSCTGTHDPCRNTPTFRHSGQNIARRTTFEDTITKENLEYNIFHGIDRWFREHPLCEEDGTTVFDNIVKKKCGHYTVMVTEPNTHLGCAVMHMKSTKTVFTCNYSWTNIRNAPLYTIGETASQCRTGVNEKYPALCSVNEIYF